MRPLLRSQVAPARQIICRKNIFAQGQDISFLIRGVLNRQIVVQSSKEILFVYVACELDRRGDDQGKFRNFTVDLENEFCLTCTLAWDDCYDPAFCSLLMQRNKRSIPNRDVRRTILLLLHFQLYRDRSFPVRKGDRRILFCPRPITPFKQNGKGLKVFHSLNSIKRCRTLFSCSEEDDITLLLASGARSVDLPLVRLCPFHS